MLVAPASRSALIYFETSKLYCRHLQPVLHFRTTAYKQELTFHFMLKVVEGPQNRAIFTADQEKVGASGLTLMQRRTPTESHERKLQHVTYSTKDFEFLNTI